MSNYSTTSYPYVKDKKSYPNKGYMKKQKSCPSFYQVKSMIKREEQSSREKKEVDTVSSDQPVNTGATVYINGMAEGTDFNQRVGRSVMHAYLQMDIVITLNAANTTGDSGQFGIVLDRQSNGGLASFNQIYDLTTASAGTAFRNTQLYSDRFKVIKTFEYNLSVTGPSQLHVREYIPLYKMLRHLDAETRYLNTTAAIASCATNSLLLVYGSILSTNLSTLNYNIRYRFTDA